MIEARIECICREIRIPDLDLFLKQGDVECIPARAARASVDLKQAVRIKAVDVLYKKTKVRTMSNRHEPPWLMRHNKNGGNVQRNIEPEKKPAPVAGLDQARLIHAIQETIRAEVSMQIKREMESFRRKLAVDMETIISQSIEVAVGTLSRKVDSIEVPAPQVMERQIPNFTIPDLTVPTDEGGDMGFSEFDDDDDILIFIPEIKSEGIQIEGETATDTGGLDSAAEALRGLKTKK